MRREKRVQEAREKEAEGSGGARKRSECSQGARETNERGESQAGAN